MAHCLNYGMPSMANKMIDRTSENKQKMVSYLDVFSYNISKQCAKITMQINSEHTSNDYGRFLYSKVTHCEQ